MLLLPSCPFPLAPQQYARRRCPARTVCPNPAVIWLSVLPASTPAVSDRHRNEALGRGVDAQLAVPVGAPAVDGARGVQRACASCPGRPRVSLARQRPGGGHRHRAPGSACAAVAQLAAAVQAPAVHGPGRVQRAGVAEARHDLAQRLTGQDPARVDRDWHIAAGRRAVPELPVGVAAPAVGLARLDRAPVALPAAIAAAGPAAPPVPRHRAARPCGQDRPSEQGRRRPSAGPGPGPAACPRPSQAMPALPPAMASPHFLAQPLPEKPRTT